MASDLTPSPTATSTSTSTDLIPAIENELPAYRAISRAAVSSLVLGVSSLFCFTDFSFLALAVAAVIFGFVGLRKIRQYPEILTGAGLARFGIALGLIFGVSSVTRVIANDWLTDRDAGEFAQHYIEVLTTKPLASALWYQQPPAYRQTKTPDDVLDELKKSKSPGGEDMYGKRTQAITQIKDRVKDKSVHVHFSRVESKVADGLTQYANALIDIDNPADKDPIAREEYALLELIKPAGGGRHDWMVKEIRYPYRPASVSATPIPTKKDDGHGH